jgi:hypothetical protein
VKVLVGCCWWGFEEEWDRFLLDWDDGGAVEDWVVISMGSGAIVSSFSSFFDFGVRVVL